MLRRRDMVLGSAATNQNLYHKAPPFPGVLAPSAGRLDTRSRMAQKERVVVTGAGGLLGRAVIAAAPEASEAAPTTRADGDLADATVVERLLEGAAAVLHLAGFSDVDAAEERREGVTRDNVTATARVAAECARRALPLVVMSTDYVFDGRLGRPYVEADAPAPLSAYGRSKLEAESAAMRTHPRGTRIVRTAWLYGPGGRHFPGRILELAGEKAEIRVVADQVGCPTSTLALAPALWDVLRAPPGIYHAACEGSCSRYELALATLEIAGVRGVRVVPCTTAEMPRPARRPAYSALDSSKLAAIRGKRLPHWRDALVRYLSPRTS
jgi:dTDP-4-dehydrorhamnose reductase